MQPLKTVQSDRLKAAAREACVTLSLVSRNGSAGLVSATYVSDSTRTTIDRQVESRHSFRLENRKLRARATRDSHLQFLGSRCQTSVGPFTRHRPTACVSIGPFHVNILRKTRIVTLLYSLHVKSCTPTSYIPDFVSIHEAGHLI